MLSAISSSGETFDVWENPLPGLRNLSVNLRGQGFMVLPASLGDHLTAAVAWLPISDALPAIELSMFWPRREVSQVTRLVVSAARHLARREGWTAGTRRETNRP